MNATVIICILVLLCRNTTATTQTQNSVFTKNHNQENSPAGEPSQSDTHESPWMDRPGGRGPKRPSVTGAGCRVPVGERPRHRIIGPARGPLPASTDGPPAAVAEGRRDPDVLIWCRTMGLTGTVRALDHLAFGWTRLNAGKVIDVEAGELLILRPVGPRTLHQAVARSVGAAAARRRRLSMAWVTVFTSRPLSIGLVSVAAAPRRLAIAR